MDTNKSDVMDAEQILEELHKLADRERQEGESTSEADASNLDDAIASLEKFVKAEKDEEQPSSPSASDMATGQKNGIVDTSTLTGPIGGLRNFLIKKSQDNQA